LLREEWLYELDDEGESPFSRALRSGNGAIMALVLSIEQEDPDQEPAIHLAARKGDAAAVRALLEKGADINEVDSHGFVPLHWASINGCLDLAKLLHNRGADLDRVDHCSTGMTPLGLAKAFNYSDIADFLMRFGASA